MSMNPAGRDWQGPGRINACKASGAGVVSHSSGLILIFEEPRAVTGVRVVAGTIVTGGSPCGHSFPIQLRSM
jgi:hypothetical protein